VRWELDLWYEMWDRAGGAGLDTWSDLETGFGEGRRGGASGVDGSAAPETSEDLVRGSEMG
jgi:hypothetical protein